MNVAEREGRGEAAAESEARFRAAADAMPVPIWVSGLDAGTQFVNRACLDFLDRLLPEVRGDGWQSHIHPDDLVRYVGAYQAAFEARAPFRCQARVRDRSGEYRWLDSVGTPRFSAAGEFLGFVGAISDIDESKRFELHMQLVNEIDLALSNLADPDEMVRATTRRLGEYLRVGRCNLCEIDLTVGTAVVHAEWEGWLDGVPSVAGHYRLEEFITPDLRETQRAGEVAVVDDVLADPRTRDHAENFRRVAAAAWVSVPARRESQWEASIFVAQSQPRCWRPDEVRLIRDVATRLWLAITRARAALALRQSEERARRTLADQMVAGVVECDSSGRFTMVNRRFCDITGYSEAELLEMQVAEITHPEDRPHSAALYRRLFETGESFLCEKRYQRKCGAPIWVNTHVSPTRDGKGRIVGWVSVVLDVSDRKRAEEELAAAKDRLASDLSFMTRLQRIGSIFVREGDLPAALTEVVYTAMGISGAQRGLVQLLDPASGLLEIAAYRGFEAPFLERFNQIPAGFEQGERLIVEDVTTSPLYAGTPDLEVMLEAGVRAMQSTPVLNRSGDLIAVFSTHYDRPGRPDERALRLLDLLAREIADIIERAQADTSLRAAYEQAETATRVKDEFLAVVSHELRNPLSSILGYARLLRAAKSTLTDVEVERMLEIIERNGKAQLQLIEDLLDTGRIISGKLKLEVQPLNLLDVINYALDVVGPAVQAKNIDLRAELDPSAGQITGDPERLQQVVWNLLSNAIKFTPEGGRVDVTLEREGPRVQMVVRDTGKGIEPEFLPHAFERFRQSDMSSARRVGGLGLGLPLVKHLVELHGGTVDAASAGVGRGAVFTVRLPVRAVLTPPPEERRARSAKMDHVLPERARSLAGVTALVVDDEEDVRTLLSFTLQGYGAEVEAMASGKLGLERLASRSFDVVLCDIGMPDQDGYAVMRELRASPPEWGGAVAAIALTAYGRAEDRMRALEAGYQMHLVKPVDPDELAVVILSLLQRFRAR